MNPRIIIHLDMDAFFAQVEERENPQFKGKPVVVCTSTPLSVHPSRDVVLIPEEWDSNKNANHPERVKRVEGWSADPKGGRGRGVVSTANYEARKFGIHSALPISQAYRLCPGAIFLPPNFELYSIVSDNIMKIIQSFSEQVEQTSLDEAYIDITEKLRSTFSAIANKRDQSKVWEKARGIAEDMRRTIWEQEKLTCSCGVGPNKMIAKIACGVAKPNGVKVVRSKEAAAFVEPLDVEKIPGIGKKTAAILHLADIQLVADLKKLSVHDLEDLFGVRGKEMYGRVRGIDEDSVVAAKEVKSIGKEITFEKDTRDPELLIQTFEQLAKQVASETLEQGLLFRQITVVCRFTGFETHTKSETLKKPFESETVLRKEAMKLFLRFLLEKQKPVRLIGVRVRICA